MTAPNVSVVLPVLNEAARIAARLHELSQLGIFETIVVDGGSSDGTVDLVRAAEHARVVEAPRGRARQMNAGARLARGDVLLFLHADVALPPDTLAVVEHTLSDPGVVAGAFRTWTVNDADGGRAPWLHLADVRSRYSKLPYGDQALFVRRAVFERLGGFPEIPLMEDLELSLRLWRLGEIRVAKACARVSGRRFLAHPLRDTFFVNVFPLLYRLGVPPARLARLYADVR
ncbi:MAG TPA: TIGR04283 family arsenosugar biosynthesis glycosyltransferase [Polyangiaceae bacterium]|nr:TIGR04283 family arsenosugar biosynthesis glycosyltransferase [Polyangiaceae bacterium]